MTCDQFLPGISKKVKRFLKIRCFCRALDDSDMPLLRGPLFVKLNQIYVVIAVLPTRPSVFFLLRHRRITLHGVVL